MRLTRFGLHGGVFYLLMLAAFFAAPYSNLFFLLLAFLTLLWAGGIASARRHLRGVTASLPELEPVPAQVRVEAPVQLHAPRPVRFGIEAHLVLEGGHELNGRIEVLDGSATLTLQAAELERGCHAVQRAFVESSHPFGLIRVQRSFDAPPELVVYPAPRDLLEGRTAPQAIDELLGDATPQAGDLQPSGLREYREGDGIRSIHWRASARSGRLVVQEWEGGSGQGLEVLLDRRCSPGELERALGTISALVHLARTNKESLKLHSQGLAATYGEGHEPWASALRFLACAEVLPADGPPPPPAAPSVARLPRAETPQGAHA